MRVHDNELNIIGNGFDLANGVESSYNDFRGFLLKDKGAGETVYNAVTVLLGLGKDWSDFESSLANMDRGVMMDVFDEVFHTFILTEDTDDDDFSYGEYYAAIEAGMILPHSIMYDMPIYFHRWLRTLKPSGPKWRCPIWLYKDATYLNFNYTEFLETRYGIPKERILYIHGDRRGKKENIILGHGEDWYDNLNRWWDSVKDDPKYQKYVVNKKGRKVPNRAPSYLVYGEGKEEDKPWRSAIQFYALDDAAKEIEDYFEQMAKNSDKVFENNRPFFQSLKNIDTINVIGHSLSRIDRPYFKEIVNSVGDADRLKWNITYHSGKEKAMTFIEELDLDPDKVKMIKV